MNIEQLQNTYKKEGYINVLIKFKGNYNLSYHLRLFKNVVCTEMELKQISEYNSEIVFTSDANITFNEIENVLNNLIKAYNLKEMI